MVFARRRSAKRLSSLFVLGLALSLGVTSLGIISGPADAKTKNSRITSMTEVNKTPYRVIGADPESTTVRNIAKIVEDLLAASNSKNVEGILNHYSPAFVSGDNLTLEQVKKLIEQTWAVYPDIRYTSKIQEIRVNGNWATVETWDEASATVNDQQGVINTPGQLKSQSRGMIYLRRMGNTWEINSDDTLYENSTILYGNAKDTLFTLSAPDQVFSGETYTAKVDVLLPAGTVAIASISKDPLVYPQLKPEDKFRSIARQSGELERVFDANDTNNNEMVTATIGLTQIGQDSQERPTVEFKGIATIIKRVNVVPKTNRKENTGRLELVKTSANGKINLEKATTEASTTVVPPVSTP